MGCTIAVPPQPLTACQYCKEITLFIGYAFCQVCIGAALMMAFCYSSHTRDYHGAFCTIGWQLLMAEGTLIMVYTHCNPLTYHHRRTTHMFIQILGLIFVLSGSVLILHIVTFAGASFKVHGWIGIVAFTFTLISALAGPIAALKYEQVKIAHGILGIPTLILSTVTFFTGAMSQAFRQYAGFTAIIMIIILSCYYALFVIVSAIFKIIKRWREIKKKPEPGWCSYGSAPSNSKDKKAKDSAKKDKKDKKETATATSSKASTSSKTKK